MQNNAQLIFLHLTTPQLRRFPRSLNLLAGKSPTRTIPSSFFRNPAPPSPSQPQILKTKLPPGKANAKTLKTPKTPEARTGDECPNAANDVTKDDKESDSVSTSPGQNRIPIQLEDNRQYVFNFVFRLDTADLRKPLPTLITRYCAQFNELFTVYDNEGATIRSFCTIPTYVKQLKNTSSSSTRIPVIAKSAAVVIMTPTASVQQALSAQLVAMPQVPIIPSMFK